MPSTPHRRKRYLINNKIQLRYSLYIFATLAIISFASSVSLSLGIWNLVVKDFSRTSLKQRLEMASQLHDYEEARRAQQTKRISRLSEFKEIDLLSIREKEIFQDILKSNNKELAVKATLLFLFIALGTIFLTHKIVGPLFRFQETFKEIKNGNLALRVHLRRTDQAHEILPYLNAMIGSLDYSLSKMKVLIKNIYQELEKRNISTGDLTRYKQELDQELNRYTTTDAYKIV